MRKTKQQYESIKDFTRRANISRTTLHRFYVKNPDLKSETVKKKITRKIPIDHAKYFNKEELIDEVRLLEDKIDSMRNLIDMVHDKAKYPTWLWGMEWSFFGTISHEYDLSKNSCYKQMIKLFDELHERFGHQTDIRLFFTTEPYGDRGGNHNHFVLYVVDDRLHQEVIEFINERFSRSRVELQPYDKYEAGLFYISKEGLQGDHWDILFNTDEKQL